MLNLLAEPFSDVESGATVNSALAAPAGTEVEVISARPDWVELRVPGELRAVAVAERLLAPSLACITAAAREAVAAAFREALENAIEHGCRLDALKRVEVGFVRFERAVVCRVEDPGEGFDPARLDHAAVNNPEDDPVRHESVREERGMRPGGFGLLLMTGMVDEMIYNERRNGVMFVKYLR